MTPFTIRNVQKRQMHRHKADWWVLKARVTATGTDCEG